MGWYCESLELQGIFELMSFMSPALLLLKQILTFSYTVFVHRRHIRYMICVCMYIISWPKRAVVSQTRVASFEMIVQATISKISRPPTYHCWADFAFQALPASPQQHLDSESVSLVHLWALWLPLVDTMNHLPFSGWQENALAAHSPLLASEALRPDQHQH